MERPHALPTGTVTLLFADVEGSTRLLNLLGERFGPARARMRELVREAARAHEGAEVDWAGDGVFLAFPRARDAVAAAAQIHRSLAAEQWPDDEAHRLRIGLHTGEPDLGPEGYVGIDVVIAARICAASHGEQVVVSQATRDVSGETPIADGSYRALGRHRLKDVPNAVQLFQLVAPDLREEFPPLKTLTATSLPALHHRLVGREDALARVDALLGEQGARLVTITGPGGAGKSRLALEVAAGAALERPVHLVGLAPIPDAELVPSAIARALGVREAGAQALPDAIGDRLEGTGALLYLDNLEHLPGASVHVAALLDRAPDLQVLTTSRSPLRLSTEHVLPLEPLSIEDAARLFTELAAARGVVLRPEALASVHEICRRLDGLPLAIELVAARLVVLPPAEIVRALGEGLALEMEGPIDLPERQRTLRAAIDWSYGRLTEDQRLLHGTLAVFSESASLEDARALAPAPTFLPDLEALVGWSLVRSEAADGSVRLSMLGTVREHALGHLREADALDELRERHAERFLQLAIDAEGELAGATQADWFERLEFEFDNIAAALDWLFSAGRVEDALRAISALERFWRGHAHVTTARRWLAQGLASTWDTPGDVRAGALRTASLLAAAQSDWAGAEASLTEARELYRELGDDREQVFVLTYLSFYASRLADDERAEEFAEEAVAVAETLDDDRASSAALSALADVHSAKGEHEQAFARYEEVVVIRARLGDPLLHTDAVYSLGKTAFHAGDDARARRELGRALEQARAIGEEQYTAAAQLLLSLVDLRSGEAESAFDRAREAFGLYTQLEDDRSRARCVLVLAAAAAERGDAATAARLTGAAEALRDGDPADEFEAPLLEGSLAGLGSALGDESLAALTTEGRTLGTGSLDPVVVSAEIEA